MAQFWFFFFDDLINFNLMYIVFPRRWFKSCYDGEDGVAYNKKCNQPKNAPDERLLPQLHTLVWEYYEGHLDEEKEVLKYIFRNACFLKKATFMNLLGSVEELESVAKASDSCQLVFE